MESTSEVVSNIIADTPVRRVEDLPENTKAHKQTVEGEVKVSVEKHAEEVGNLKVETTTKETQEMEQIEPSCASKEIKEDVLEEVEDDDDKEEVVDGINQKITEDVTDTPDGGQTKTITVTTACNNTASNSTAAEEQPTTPPPTTQAAKASERKEEYNEHDELKQKEEVEEETEEEDEEEQELIEEQDNEKVVNRLKQSEESLKQQLHTDQIPQEPEPQQTPAVKEETVVDAPAVVTQITSQHEPNISNKQDNLNNTIRDIISSIDSNIKAEENIAALKQRELELLKKQQELAKEIEQQKLLAQQLSNENQMKQQLNKNLIQQEISIPPSSYQPTTNVSKYSTFEETQDNNVYSRKSETYETRESTNVSKKIDLNKIFTPATDAEEILPKNRKLYASSAFYSPTLHPTVEDQVELARRISHSLSDISNQQSRGQSMYVNRKKRSVKWVHEGCGQDGTENRKITNQEEYDEEEKENDVSHHEKVPLKFLMNPSGQMRDINSLRESINTETGLLSPDVSAEVVTALQAQKGKGAELFAKRRKVSEKWVVDESNVGAQSPSGLPDYHQYQQQPKPSTSPSILPAYTDAAKHRVQLNLHQEQLMEKYAKPGLTVVQTPWEAALSSGSASTAFVEQQNLSPYPVSTLTPSPTPQIIDAIPDRYSKTYSTDDYQSYSKYAAPQQQAQQERQQYTGGTNSQRELAYKPSIPQGWKAPSMSLPKGFEEQYRSETNFIANEAKLMQQQQQQQQQITTVNEAMRSCEDFSTTDETELIDLIRNAADQQVASETSKHISQPHVHEFVNHFIKSPELRVSPIPITTQVIYDNAVQELYIKQQNELHKLAAQRSTDSNCDTQKESIKEKEEKVNVRKQLQQYEDLQRRLAKQIEQEELLQKRREASKLKATQYQNKKLTNATVKSPASDNSLQPEQQNDEEEYVKVAVKELITNFEQQCLQEVKPNTQSALTPSSTAAATSKENGSLVAEQQVVTKDFDSQINKDLYMPKEIPLQSYAPPPVVAMPTSVSPFAAKAVYETKPFSTLNTSPSLNEPARAVSMTYGGSNTFPVSKPYQQGFTSTYGNSQPPKQQYLPPESYQKVPQNTGQNIPQVNFNPSPLPYDKLAKFENQPVDDMRYNNSPPSRGFHLNVRASKVRNTSPAPFAGACNRAYTPSSDGHYYGGARSGSPRPVSSTQQYSGHNTPNLSYPGVTSNQVLNALSYNTTARGWGCSGGGSSAYKYNQSQLSSATKPPQIINAASMPYTDF